MQSSFLLNVSFCVDVDVGIVVAAVAILLAGCCFFASSPFSRFCFLYLFLYFVIILMLLRLMMFFWCLMFVALAKGEIVCWHVCVCMICV